MLCGEINISYLLSINIAKIGIYVSVLWILLSVSIHNCFFPPEVFKLSIPLLSPNIFLGTGTVLWWRDKKGFQNNNIWK